MTWLKSNWRKLVVAGCGAVGGAALVVPALVPAAAICAAIVPGVLGGASALDILKNIVKK